MQRRRDHLDFWEGPTHAVGVHDRHTEAGGDRHRDHGIHAPGLDRQGRYRATLQPALQQTKGVQHLRTSRALFHQDRGRTHHRRGDDPRVVWHLVEGEQLDGPVPRHRLLCHQFAQRRVAPAARAEHRGAERYLFQGFVVKLCHCGSIGLMG